MNKLRYGLILGAILSFPVMVSAQMPGMIPWWDRPIARNLGLSEEQHGQIRAVVREARDHLIELRAAVEKAEGDLSDQMNEDSVNRAKAEAAIDKVVTARAELMRAVSRMSLNLRMILTAAQWQELQRREGRLRGSAGRRGAMRPGASGRPNSPLRNQ